MKANNNKENQAPDEKRMMNQEATLYHHMAEELRSRGVRPIPICVSEEAGDMLESLII